MVKIQSISDVITNSSSEVFVIKTNKTPQEFYDFLLSKKNDEDECSGMGGEMTVYNCKEVKGDRKHYAKYASLPEGFLYIDLDQGFRNLINLIESEPGFIGNDDDGSNYDLQAYEHSNSMLICRKLMPSLDKLKDPDIKSLVIKNIKLIKEFADNCLKDEEL